MRKGRVCTAREENEQNFASVICEWSHPSQTRIKNYSTPKIESKMNLTKLNSASSQIDSWIADGSITLDPISRKGLSMHSYI
jgi:hypothetical protein